jgi:hypothetical protein
VILNRLLIKRQRSPNWHPHKSFHKRSWWGHRSIVDQKITIESLYTTWNENETKEARLKRSRRSIKIRRNIGQSYFRKYQHGWANIRGKYNTALIARQQRAASRLLEQNW